MPPPRRGWRSGPQKGRRGPGAVWGSGREVWSSEGRRRRSRAGPFLPGDPGSVASARGAMRDPCAHAGQGSDR